MSAVVEKGSKLLVVHRRLFPKDELRYFVGRTVAYDCGVVKLRGMTYVRNMTTGSINPRPDERTKIISLSSGTFLVYELPESVDLESFYFQTSEGTVSAVDGKGFEMNLDEHPLV